MSHRFGWCEGLGRVDQFHERCPGEYVSVQGVIVRCGCPNHEWPNEEEN